MRGFNFSCPDVLDALNQRFEQHCARSFLWGLSPALSSLHLPVAFQEGRSCCSHFTGEDTEAPASVRVPSVDLGTSDCWRVRAA